MLGVPMGTLYEIECGNGGIFDCHQSLQSEAAIRLMGVDFLSESQRNLQSNGGRASLESLSCVVAG